MPLTMYLEVAANLRALDTLSLVRAYIFGDR